MQQTGQGLPYVVVRLANVVGRWRSTCRSVFVHLEPIQKALVLEGLLFCHWGSEVRRDGDKDETDYDYYFVV